jgi:hypothetical protein
MLGSFWSWSRRWVAHGSGRRYLLIALLTVLSRELHAQTPDPQEPSNPPPATDVPPATEPLPEPAVLESPPPATDSNHLFPTFERDDFQGSLWTSYRYRSTYHDHDQDLYQSLLLNIGKPERDTITFTFQGQAFYDLDLNHPDSPFYSVQDTYDSRLTAQLLQAYAELHRLDFIESVKIGRQDWSLIPEVSLFDGISASTIGFTSWHLRFNALAGVPTHLYESSSSGDSIYGGGVEVQPASGTWASLNYASIKDSLESSDEHNGFLTFEARQVIKREFQAGARITGVDWELRDVNLRLSYAGVDNGWSGQIAYYKLFHTQKQLVTELDPYVEVLGDEQPFSEWRLLVSKNLSEMWTVDAGIWFRKLEDDGDEGAFNHDFTRYYVTPTMHDWPLDRMSISVTGEFWDAEDQTVATYGFDITKELNDQLRLSLGSVYEMFKFSPFFGDEREDDTTIYLRGRWNMTENVHGDLDLEWETDSLDTYRTVRVAVGWSF